MATFLIAPSPSLPPENAAARARARFREAFNASDLGSAPELFTEDVVLELHRDDRRLVVEVPDGLMD